MAKSPVGKVVTLDKETARSLAEAPLRAIPTFIELAEWRNRSGSSPQENIPYWMRKEADRMRRDPNYKPHFY